MKLRRRLRQFLFQHGRHLMTTATLAVALAVATAFLATLLALSAGDGHDAAPPADAGPPLVTLPVPPLPSAPLPILDPDVIDAIDGSGIVIVPGSPGEHVFDFGDVLVIATFRGDAGRVELVLDVTRFSPEGYASQGFANRFIDIGADGILDILWTDRAYERILEPGSAGLFESWERQYKRWLYAMDFWVPDGDVALPA